MGHKKAILKKKLLKFSQNKTEYRFLLYAAQQVPFEYQIPIKIFLCIFVL